MSRKRNVPTGEEDIPLDIDAATLESSTTEVRKPPRIKRSGVTSKTSAPVAPVVEASPTLASGIEDTNAESVTDATVAAPSAKMPRFGQSENVETNEPPSETTETADKSDKQLTEDVEKPTEQPTSIFGNLSTPEKSSIFGKPPPSSIFGAPATSLWASTTFNVAPKEGSLFGGHTDPRAYQIDKESTGGSLWSMADPNRCNIPASNGTGSDDVTEQLPEDPIVEKTEETGFDIHITDNSVTLFTMRDQKFVSLGAGTVKALTSKTNSDKVLIFRRKGSNKLLLNAQSKGIVIGDPEVKLHKNQKGIRFAAVNAVEDETENDKQDAEAPVKATLFMIKFLQDSNRQRLVNWIKD